MRIMVTTTTDIAIHDISLCNVMDENRSITLHFVNTGTEITLLPYEIISLMQTFVRGITYLGSDVHADHFIPMAKQLHELRGIGLTEANHFCNTLLGYNYLLRVVLPAQLANDVLATIKVTDKTTAMSNNGSW